jgi:hypothetical protein
MNRNHKPIRQLINPTEADEKEYLGEIILKLDTTIDYANRSVNAHAADVKEITAYLWEHKESMDRRTYSVAVGNQHPGIRVMPHRCIQLLQHNGFSFVSEG